MKRKLPLVLLWISLVMAYGCDITEPNVPPEPSFVLEIANDNYMTTVNEPLMLDLLTNDKISHKAEVSIVRQGAHGLLQVMPGVSGFQYSPGKNFSGYDTMQYEVICQGKNAMGTVYVTIEDTNHSYGIDAKDDEAEALPHRSQEINVGDNDIRWELEAEIQIVQSPTHGEVTFDHANQILTYTPHDGVMGVYDTIVYRVYSSPTNYSDAQVIIHIKWDCEAYFKAMVDEVPVFGTDYTFSREYLFSNDFACDDDMDIDSFRLVSTTTKNGSSITLGNSYPYIRYKTSQDPPYTDEFSYEICNASGDVCSTGIVTVIGEE